MLNLKGAFVVIFANAVQTHILGARVLEGYYERAAIVGFVKANQFIFGGEALAALPCTLECMTEIALNYPDTEPMAQLVRAICARVALGQPVGGDTSGDDTEGGLGIKAEHTKPKKPSGGNGARVSVPNNKLPASLQQ